MINLPVLDRYIEDNAKTRTAKPGVNRDKRADEYLSAIHDGRVSIDFHDGECFMGSLTHPGTSYQVSYFECSCPDHVYNKQVCCHMRAFRNLNKGLDNLSDTTLAKLAEQAKADLGF